MTIQTESIKKKTILDMPILANLTLNWEFVLYLTFFVLAVASRLYNMGDRGMSHDESLHALYSWKLYAGQGYQHDPMMHGPFLFHINALMYFLFGDNDFTARIAPALFGMILVMLPYWFRPWLGKIGALAASFMILISPGLAYYSRYIRHDPFISVWTAIMVLAMFQYMRTRANKWIYIEAATISFMLTTMETAYIHGFIWVTFVGLTWLWETLPKSARQILEYGLIVGILLVGIFGAFLVQATTLMLPGTEINLVEHIPAVITLMIMLIAALLTKLGADLQNQPVTNGLKSLQTRLPELGKAALLATVIFTLFFTTFFSNIGGLYTGSIGALQYWLNQHGVQRGGQPWFYYLMLEPLYEFLPLLVAMVGSLVYIIRGKGFPSHVEKPTLNSDPDLEIQNPKSKIQNPSDGGTFISFAIYWAISAFAIYSWAGEKMPWLTVHITLPLVFVAAHVIQSGLDNLNWTEIRQKGGFVLGGAILLVMPALVALSSVNAPFRSQSLQSIEDTSKFIAAMVVLTTLAVVIVQVVRQMGLALARQVTFMTLLVLLSLLTIRTTWMFNYINYDYVSEPMVYAHASPDVKLALGQIDEISRRTVGDKMIKVAYDNDSTWPLEWYMREYPNRAYYGDNPNRDSLDAPIVIVGAANESKVKPYLGDKYTRFNYRLVWWPLEEYKNITPQSLWENYVTGTASETDENVRRDTVRKNRESLWKIVFYRQYQNYKLSEWPFVHRFYLYIRNDVLNQVWDYQSGPVKLTQAISLDPYQGKHVQATALTSWGSSGTADGQFNTPRNLAVATDGKIYVADSGNHRIQVFDKDGNFLFKWGSNGAAKNQFNEPWGIAVNKDGQVFVADTWNHRVEVFTDKGEFVREFGTFANAQSNPETDADKFWGPRGLATDAEGNVYVTDTGNKRVQKFTADGKLIHVWGGGGIVAGKFEEPVGIGLDKQGNIYVADTWNERVQKFDANFNPLADWKVVGWEGEGIFNKPFLAVDAQNRVVISDPERYRLIAYSDKGDLLGTWGEYGRDLSAFALPTGLVFDNEGNLLVADADNNRIMKFAMPKF